MHGRVPQLGEIFPTDPGVRLETAQVFRVIGGIGRITGQFAKSRDVYDKAIEVLTRLCEDDPDEAGKKERTDGFRVEPGTADDPRCMPDFL